MYELSMLGFGPFFEKQLTTDNVIVARIVAEHRGGYQVCSSQGSGVTQLAGKLTRELHGETFPGVGDWVTIASEPTSDHFAIIKSVLDRRTVFVRGRAGRSSRGQVVAANMDVVFVICGLDNDYNLRRIERYLARIWASGAQPVVVLNKSDVCGDVNERLSEVQSVCLGVDVIAISAIRQEGVDSIRSYFPYGIIAVLVGSSGAGKSTIINALLGEDRMRTNEIRTSDGRGRHTTTHRQLMVIPGMREMQLFDEEGIGAVFSDIEKLSAYCRFRDCSHTSEPACAVLEAVENGGVSSDR